MDTAMPPPPACYFPDRLLDKLRAGLWAPVTVVEAPAGYGKTTALKRLEELCVGQARVHWFAALKEDAGDAWERLCKVLSGIDPAVSDNLLAQGTPSQSRRQLCVQALCQLHCAEETVLILDNFQNLPREMEALISAALLHRVSPGLHVIISTQYFRAARETAEALYHLNRITTSDLTLNAQEIRALFAQAGISIQAHEADVLYHRTEGWPLAVSLFLRGGGDNAVLSESCRADCLLADVYYDRLSPLEQARLLPFALFDAISEGQMSQLSGEPVSAKTRELVRRTPLIRYDAAEGVHYPHALLQDFLLLRLKSAPDEQRKSIYMSAGQWHAGKGNICQAIACFHTIKAYERILALPLVNLCHARAGQVPFTAVAREILASCPMPVLAKYPISLLRLAYFLFAAADFTGYGVAMEKARQITEESGDMTLKGEWLVMDALSAFPDAHLMGQRLSEAIKLIKGRCQVVAAEEPFLFGCTSMWLLFYTSPGEGDRIGRELEDAVRLYNTLTGGHAGGADVLYRAELACMRGDHEEARLLAYEAGQLSEDAKQPTVSIGAALLLGRIAISHSDVEGLKTAIAYLESKASAFPFMKGSAMNKVMLDTSLRTLRAMMQQNCHNPKRAQQTEPGEESPSVNTLMNRYAIITDIILEGDYAKAIGIIEATLRVDKRVCTKAAEYYLYVGLALCCLGLSRQTQALEALDKAMAIGSPDGLVSLFVHHRGILTMHFDDPALKEKYGAFIQCVRSIRAKFPGDSFSALADACQRDFPDSLTQRERQIAILAAQGLRNREIAEREFISEQTVKNHLKTVFSKLDIDRRARLADLLCP
ncbi:MAG: LuxR C-terminal-related transcriptional regulator [Eubacteriales bacterium]|nr:LuxR C-terminal-related transcriptional regulator [Eubacteriales bacterium]